MSERQRGRRPAAPPKTQSIAEREIRALQKKKLAAQAKVDEVNVELAHLMSDWMAKGVQTNDICTWLVSDDKPNGVSRQQVYKMVAALVDGKSVDSRRPVKTGPTIKPVRPKVKAPRARPKIKRPSPKSH